MHPQKPVVRHFLACEQVERSLDNRHISLHNVIYAIQPKVPYPIVHPKIDFFVLMADGRGQLKFSLELIALGLEHEELIYTTSVATMEFGQDPLVVFAWPMRLFNVPFNHSGLYEFRLRCNEETIAREPILLKESK